MSQIRYLLLCFFIAGILLLQPSAFSAADQLVKPEEKQEKQQQAQPSPQPAVPSGFGYVMANATGNLIKLLSVAAIGGCLYTVVLSIVQNLLPSGYLIWNYFPENLDVKNDEAFWLVAAATYFLIAFFAKLGFYFLKGYAWVKVDSTAFMVGQQLLLLATIFGFRLLVVSKDDEADLALEAVLLVIWLPMIYFPMFLFDLGLGALWQRPWTGSCLLG